jgi:hypothetical protein
MLDVAGLNIGGKQQLELPEEYNPLTQLLDGFKSAVGTKTVHSNLVYIVVLNVLTKTIKNGLLNLMLLYK